MIHFRRSIFRTFSFKLKKRHFSTFSISPNPIWAHEHVKCGSITVRQEIDFSKASEIGLGAVVWDSAICLSSIITDYLKPIIHDKRCLELGAGVGLCGLSAASVGCDTVLTDLDIMIPLLRENADLNDLKNVEIRELDWRDCAANDFLVNNKSKGKRVADFLLGADLIFVDPDRSDESSFFSDLQDVLAAYLESCHLISEENITRENVQSEYVHSLFGENMGGVVLMMFEERGDLTLRNLGDLFIPLINGSDELRRRYRVIKIHLNPHTTETNLTLVGLQAVEYGSFLDNTEKVKLGFVQGFSDRNILIEELGIDNFVYLR